MDDLTPAKAALRDQLARTRQEAHHILELAIGLFAKLDTVSVHTPLPSHVSEELVKVAAALRTANLAIAEAVVHPEVDGILDRRHPGWTELRSQLLRVVRSARWLWAQETKVHDDLLAGRWSSEAQNTLAGVLLRLEKLAVSYGFPLTHEGDKHHEQRR